MPNWKKVITSGSDALLNQITSSGGIDSPDITIDDWGSVSASLATLDTLSNPTLQDVTDNGSTTTNSITISDTASIDYLEVNNRLQGNGSGFQFFAYNEDTVKTKFANWYSSNDRQYGMGQLWFETWFAAIDNQAQRDNRRIGFYLEEPDAGSADSGTPGQHPSNSRFYVDINGAYLSGSLNVESSITGSDVTISDWGSVSASLASLDTLSNPTLQDVTDNGSTTTNALTINNGTLGATSLHVDGNADFPLKVTSDNLTGDPYMELGGDGIRIVDPVNEDLKIRIGPTGDVNLVARFEYDPPTGNRNFLMQGTGSISGYDIIATNSLTLDINNISNAGTDTDKFLVLDAGGTVDFRTGAEVRSDIGAGTGNGSVTSVGGTGTVSGLSLSGTVTTSGNLTLGGTISLVAGDIPDLNASKITAGTFAVARIPDITSAKITDVDAFSQSGTYANLRAQATTKGDVGLGNVENTALSTWGGSSNITTIGTVTSGDVSAILPSGTISGSITSPSQGTISVNGNNIDLGLQVGDSPTFNDVTISGNLTVEGTRTELQVTELNVEDKNILVASGAADSAAADGAGITIGGANESLTWDHSNSRFAFSDDLRVDNSLNIGSVSNAGVDTDKFLVLDSNGNVDYRTGAEVLSDIGAGTSNYGDSDVTDHINSLNVVSGSSQITISNTSGYTTFSSSLATDISSNTSTLNSKPSKYAASGSRMTVWKDSDTVRGFDSLHYFDNGGNDIGIRLNPSSVTGRTIRTGQSGGSSGVQLLITRNPNKTYGATIDYVVFNSLTNRTAYRIGREVSAWDNNGANIVGTGYTSFGFGTLPADLEVSIIESSGEMYLQMTWSGGGTYYISANIDTFGSGI